MVSEGARERLQFIRPASLPGTEVLAVYQSSRRWHLFHERYAFVVARKAATTVRYRGLEQRIHDGTLVVREPGETSCCTAVTKPAEVKVLFVDAPLLADAAREVGHTGILHFAPVPISDPDLFWLFCRLCSSIEDGDDGLEQQTLFAMCMVKVAQHAERPPRATELRNGKLAVARAKAYLSEHCSEPVSLHNLARVSGFSRFGLVHAFTKEVGLSPHAYQVHVRIERARALLQQGVSPATVATTMGFADQSHFTRHFRRILQVTPSQYAGRSIAWQSRAGAFGNLRAGGTWYSSSYTPLSSLQ
jgi:AraC-like DNA-binding protein